MPYFYVITYDLTKKLIICVLCLCTLCGLSQTRRRNFRQSEIGIFGGGIYYLGDLNQRKHFIYTQPAIGAFYRMALNYRIAFRGGFSYGNISASDAKSKEPDQLERNFHFRSRVYEAHALAEFNFVEYRIGNNNHYFTMFTFAGIGGYYFNPQSNINGTGYVDLSQLNTEGQSRSYSNMQMNLPFGVGIKWNIHEWWGLGFEWGPRKLFTDYLDDVSGVYPLTGAMRGNPRSKDWYFFYGFTLQVKLPKRSAACPAMKV